jgi:hypothetical protein
MAETGLAMAKPGVHLRFTPEGVRGGMRGLCSDLLDALRGFNVHHWRQIWRPGLMTLCLLLTPSTIALRVST